MHRKPIVFDLVDAESPVYEQSLQIQKGATPIGRGLQRQQLIKLKRYERAQMRYADVCLVSSTTERDKLHRIGHRGRFLVVPNTVDTDYFCPSSSPRGDQQPTIVFPGTMWYGPNIDGAQYLVRKILPLVRERVPQTRVFLVGRDPAREVRDLAGARVTVTGSVPDVRPYLRQAGLVAVPLRYGGGTRTKILEAMAMGIPVVSTSLGAEGLEVSKEVGVHIVDDPQEFAAACSDILAAPCSNDAQSLRARKHVLSHYGKGIAASEINRCYRGLENRTGHGDKPC
jgi:glycosyltransferase involved in cell wall biosynthesis